MDRSSVYEKVVEATKATLKQALRDAPAFTNQVGAASGHDTFPVSP